MSCVDDEAIGCEVWLAARVMLRWLRSAPNLGAPVLRGQVLLELGAGTGYLAAGLDGGRCQGNEHAANSVGVKRIFATEGNLEALDFLRLNVRERGCSESVIPLHWDWSVQQEAPAEVPLEELDLIVGTDIVYPGAYESCLVTCIAHLLLNPRISSACRALLLLCDRPPLLHSGPKKPRREKLARSMRAVDRFLSACEEKTLRVTEMPIHISLLEGEGGDGSGGILRLFEIRARSE